MKCKIIFSVIFSSFIFSGCSIFHEKTASTVEGTVTYKITYPPDNPYKGSRFLPPETILSFKNTKASFITSAMGIIQVVNLLDFENNKYTTLLINSFGENFAFTETPEDVTEQEVNPEYSFKTTNEKKIIAGLECNKAIVSDISNNTTFEIYYYEKIKVFLGCSPFKNFNYLLMEYKHSKFGLPMQLQAVKVDFAPIDTNLLNINGEFRWVDRETFISVIKNLKVPF